MLCPNLIVISKSFSMHFRGLRMKLLVLRLTSSSTCPTLTVSVPGSFSRKVTQVAPLTCAVSCTITAQVSTAKLNTRTIFCCFH